MTDPKTPEAADPLPALPESPDSPAEGLPPPKPRRRRSPKAAAPEAAEPGTLAEGPAADAGADHGAPEVVRPEPAALGGAPAANGSPTPLEAGESSSPLPSGGDQAAAADGAASALRGQPAEGGEEGRRKRSRNRRRNRRGEGRGEDGARAEGGAILADQPEGTDSITQPPTVAPNLPPTDPAALFADLVSGAYDAVSDPPEGDAAALVPDAPQATSADEPPAPAPRRVLLPDAEAPKLQKVLAQSGVGSRRDIEQMIIDARVAVNGQAAHVGQRIKRGDRVTLDGKPVKIRIAPPPARVLAYHKPVGEVVTHDDPQARPTVFRRLPRLPHGKWQSVGRLDINTEGLLLFTNSGDLANRLMHPRFGVEREYAVRVLGTLDEAENQRLLDGVEIDGQVAAFSSIVDGGGEGVNHWYRVVIHEGRNREVRKLFDAVGKAVSRLIRIRYGSVVLPRGLKRGVWVDLGADDLEALRQATGMPVRDGKGKGQGRGRADGRGETRGEGGPRDAGADGERRGKRGPRRGRHEPRVARPGHGGEEQAFLGRDIGVDDDDDFDHVGPIPNPLQQTYDKRAIQQARKQREYSEDGPIPNPLQQTYDKRAIQGERKPKREYSEDGPIPNPLQQTYDKRFASGGKPAGGGQGPRSGPRRGAPGQAPRKPGTGPKGMGMGKGAGRSGGKGAGGQPDPMRTAVGYIGSDAFVTKREGGGNKGGKGRGRRGK